MPKRKEIDPPSTTILKFRIPIKLKIEYLRLKEAGYWSTKAEASFLGYLLELGVNKYKKVMLPGELSDDEATQILEKVKKQSPSVIDKAVEKFNKKKASGEA